MDFSLTNAIFILCMQAEIQTHIQNSSLRLTLELMRKRKNDNGES